jgi:branched-subunit amino acid ABC-type transport system permease component
MMTGAYVNSNSGESCGKHRVAFFPIALPFFPVFVLLVGVLIALIEIGILRYAYEKMGAKPRYISLLLIGLLLGNLRKYLCGRASTESFLQGLLPSCLLNERQESLPKA